MNLPLILASGVVAACLIAAAAAILNSPEVVFGDESPSPAAVRVAPAGSIQLEPGDTAAQIAQRLHAAGLIDSPRRWTTLVQLLGWEDGLEVGSYSFEAGLTSYEIVRRIHSGEHSPLRVIIPEGLRLEQFAERLEAAEIVSAADFLAALRRPENVAGTRAASRPPGLRPEGYLFPGGYEFPLDVTADQVVRIMAQRFDAEAAPILLNADPQGRTLHAILTVASIIEREAAVNEERPIIAAVLWNRIEIGMPLQVDPTVQYAAANDPASVAAHGWWKRELTLEDLALASPWNTYTAPELPPTPIAAPGLASLRAALAPADVNYLFFFARGDGTHAFAETYEEHQANIEQWSAQ